MPGGVEQLNKIVDDAAQAQEQRAAGGKAAPAEAAPAEAAHTFFVYRDGSGTEHIVDSVELVPAPYRAKAKKWVMEGEPQGVEQVAETVSEALTQTMVTVASPLSVARRPETMHVPSMLVGVIGAAALFLGGIAWRTRARGMVKGALVLAALALGGGAYIGWMRRQTGLGDEMVASPQRVVESAHKAAERMEKKLQADQKMLEEIDEGIVNEQGKKRR